MFLTKPGVVHQCPVVDYTLHPEFDEDTLNTIALLTLECNDKDVDCTSCIINIYLNCMQFILKGLLCNLFERMKYL